MISLIRNLFSVQEVTAELPIAPFEAAILDNMAAEPSKWFIDHTDAIHLLRIVNRERGLILTVTPVILQGSGLLESGWKPLARCGKVWLGERFSTVCQRWAVAEYNRRHLEEVERERERLAQHVMDSFK
jgi:hypothetical protein